MKHIELYYWPTPNGWKKDAGGNWLIKEFD